MSHVISAAADVRDEHDAVVVSREFHLDELKEFNGSQPDKPIYIALLGEVYDVTSSRRLYGPGLQS